MVLPRRSSIWQIYNVPCPSIPHSSNNSNHKELRLLRKYHITSNHVSKVVPIRLRLLISYHNQFYNSRVVVVPPFQVLVSTIMYPHLISITMRNNTTSIPQHLKASKILKISNNRGHFILPDILLNIPNLQARLNRILGRRRGLGSPRLVTIIFPRLLQALRYQTSIFSKYHRSRISSSTHRQHLMDGDTVSQLGDLRQNDEVLRRMQLHLSGIMGFPIGIGM